MAAAGTINFFLLAFGPTTPSDLRRPGTGGGGAADADPTVNFLLSAFMLVLVIERFCFVPAAVALFVGSCLAADTHLVVAAFPVVFDFRPGFFAILVFVFVFVLLALPSRACPGGPSSSSGTVRRALLVEPFISFLGGRFGEAAAVAAAAVAVAAFAVAARVRLRLRPNPKGTPAGRVFLNEITTGCCDCRRDTAPVTFKGIPAAEDRRADDGFAFLLRSAFWVVVLLGGV